MLVLYYMFPIEVPIAKACLEYSALVLEWFIEKGRFNQQLSWTNPPSHKAKNNQTSVHSQAGEETAAAAEVTQMRGPFDSSQGGAKN